MRAYRNALVAAFLAASTLLVAEQSASTSHAAKNTRPRSAQLRATHAGGPSRSASATLAEQAPANSVVIYNGNQKQTRVFNSSLDPVAPVQNLTPAVVRIVDSRSTSQAVVLGIASAESGNQPVVIGVASTGFQAAGAVQPVAVGVSPRPAKRPPYRPAALDRQ